MEAEAEICRDRDGRPEPDPELRDTENVPLREDVESFFEREVKPHAPDAWIDTTHPVRLWPKCRGLYRRADAEITEHHTHGAVSARVPGAIICLLTALTIYEIGTQLPAQVWIAIPHKARAPRVRPCRSASSASPAPRCGMASRTPISRAFPTTAPVAASHCRAASPPGRKAGLRSIVDDEGMTAIGVNRPVRLDACGEDVPGQLMGTVQRARLH